MEDLHLQCHDHDHNQGDQKINDTVRTHCFLLWVDDGREYCSGAELQQHYYLRTLPHGEAGRVRVKKTSDFACFLVSIRQYSRRREEAPCLKFGGLGMAKEGA